MAEELTVAQAAKLVEMTPGQVSQAIFMGLVCPQVHQPDGTGDASVLGPRNVRELRLISRLKKSGIRQDVIKNVIELLATSKMDWWKGDESYVVAFKDQFLITDNPFSQANLKLFEKEGILLLVKL